MKQTPESVAADLARLKADLLTLPDQLHEAERDLAIVKVEIGDLQIRIRDRELETKMLIAGDKARGKNETERAAERQRVLGEDAQYQAMQRLLTQLEIRRRQYELQASLREKEFQAKRSAMDGTVAEANLLIATIPLEAR